MSLHMSTAQRSMSIFNNENEKMPRHSTYASFGDEGVTATANSHGHLLQIRRHFENEPSGFFCVDLPDVPSTIFYHSSHGKATRLLWGSLWGNANSC
ncbi:hypothetical protein V8C42DRAFT_321614 [Trichoderma barbatum]